MSQEPFRIKISMAEVASKNPENYLENRRVTAGLHNLTTKSKVKVF